MLIEIDNRESLPVADVVSAKSGGRESLRVRAGATWRSAGAREARDPTKGEVGGGPIACTGGGRTLAGRLVLVGWSWSVAVVGHTDKERRVWTRPRAPAFGAGRDPVAAIQRHNDGREHQRKRSSFDLPSSTVSIVAAVSCDAVVWRWWLVRTCADLSPHRVPPPCCPSLPVLSLPSSVPPSLCPYAAAP